MNPFTFFIKKKVNYSSFQIANMVRNIEKTRGCV